jgi:sulfur oxidation c-type cytochrome SoxA
MFSFVNNFVLLKNLKTTFFCAISVLTLTAFLSCGSANIQSYSDPAKAEIARQKELESLARGKAMWFDSELGSNGRSCESCHPGGEMTRAENYPRYKHILRTMATISMTHNFAVVNESKGKAWELGSDDANALALFVTSMAYGKKIEMAWPLEYKKEWVEKGRLAFSDTTIGSNGMSCHSCHQKRRENRHNLQEKLAPSLTGSSGTFPRYSFEIGKVITLEQQVNYCIENYLKGSSLPLDDKTIVALCSYLTALSEGKKISVAPIN